MNIGIDVGGTNLVAGLIGDSGEMFSRKKQLTGQGRAMRLSLDELKTWWSR